MRFSGGGGGEVHDEDFCAFPPSAESPWEDVVVDASLSGVHILSSSLSHVRDAEFLDPLAASRFEPKKGIVSIKGERNVPLRRLLSCMLATKGSVTIAIRRYSRNKSGIISGDFPFQ